MKNLLFAAALVGLAAGLRRRTDEQGTVPDEHTENESRYEKSRETLRQAIRENIRRAVFFYGGVSAAAFIALAAWSIEPSGEFLAFLKTMGGLGLITLSAISVGALFGFLFGVPRAPQAQISQPGSPEARSRSTEITAAGRQVSVGPTDRSPPMNINTNLEEISDWLTKTLIGAGLTQLTSFPALLRKAGEYFGSNHQDSAIVIALIIFGVGSGFLASYVFTRLVVTVSFNRSEALKRNESRFG